jgi:hypothetical protein
MPKLSAAWMLLQKKTAKRGTVIQGSNTFFSILKILDMNLLLWIKNSLVFNIKYHRLSFIHKKLPVEPLGLNLKFEIFII